MLLTQWYRYTMCTRHHNKKLQVWNTSVDQYESYLGISQKRHQCSNIVLQVLGTRAKPKHKPEGIKYLYCWGLARGAVCCWLAELSFLLLVRRLGENKQLGSHVFISEVSALQGQKTWTKWDTERSMVDLRYLADTCGRERPSLVLTLIRSGRVSGKTALASQER